MLFRVCTLPWLSTKNTSLVIPKCCPPGEVTNVILSYTKGLTCVKDEQLNWNATLYNNYKTKASDRDAASTLFRLLRPEDWNSGCNLVLYSHRGDYSFQ